MTAKAAKSSATEAAEDRTINRARIPHSKEFLEYIASGWEEQDKALPTLAEVAPFAAARRARVAARFAGKIVFIAAGDPKQRSNDTDYRFRAHSAFSHLTGWGSDTEPGSVLVIDARELPETGEVSQAQLDTTVKSTLYFRETAGRDNDEFFANPAIGEFWVGARPNLQEVSKLLAMPTGNLADLAEFEKSIPAKLRLDLDDAEVAEFVSVLRMVKDEYEIRQMRGAVAATVAGFEDVVRALPVASKTPTRGERVVEAAFFARARFAGNDLGYDTIAASGPNACILHWISNHGPVRDGQLILVDAGVELESLYTADITRTLPVNGKFTEVQRMIYEAVLEAADAAFAVAKPGVQFKTIHATAIEVIAHRTAGWGLLPVSVEESLQPEKQFHRRWMVHGTSHHLGMDVHDCAQARRDMYMDAELQPGMIFTIEPGLYFHSDDTLVPEEFRGIGIRIEDDVLVTETGVENLSAALPRRPDEIEAWMAGLLKA